MHCHFGNFANTAHHDLSVDAEVEQQLAIVGGCCLVLALFFCLCLSQDRLMRMSLICGHAVDVSALCTVVKFVEPRPPNKRARTDFCVNAS